MRRPVTSHEPLAVRGSPPSNTMFASVMLRDADPFNPPPERPSRFSTSSKDDSRSPYLALNPPVASSKR